MILKSKKGQGTLEMILVLTLVLLVWQVVNKTLVGRGVYQKIFGDPWVRLSNTAEFGVPSNKNNVAGQHPAHASRHQSRYMP